jgi:serine protease Do
MNNFKKILTYILSSFLGAALALTLMWVGFHYFVRKEIPHQNYYEEQAAEEGYLNPVQYDKLDTSRRNAIVEAAEKVGPAVVSINVIQQRMVRGRSPFDDMFGLFFRDFYPYYYERKIPSMGSGVIINEKGYILTNAHVVENSVEITVSLPDGRDFSGELIAEDDEKDLAVIKIEGDNLPYGILGDSDDLMIGEWAIAIGNPFGNLIADPQPTVTAGVISATHRQVRQEKQRTHIYRNLIQTDASINPGNSGGPLVNCKGEVIGINTFIFTKTGGSMGMGFAIPINAAKKTVNEIMKYGKIRDVWIGIHVQQVTPLLAQSLGLSRSEGLLISHIEPGSPADEAEMQRGDFILEINGEEVVTTLEAESALYGVHVGDDVEFKIERDGNVKEIDFVVKEKK